MTPHTDNDVVILAPLTVGPDSIEFKEYKILYWEVVSSALSPSAAHHQMDPYNDMIWDKRSDRIAPWKPGCRATTCTTAAAWREEVAAKQAEKKASEIAKRERDVLAVRGWIDNLRNPQKPTGW